MESQNLDRNAKKYDTLNSTFQNGFENSTFSSIGSNLTQLPSFDSTPYTVQSDANCCPLDTLHRTSSSLEQTTSFPGDMVNKTQLPDDLSDFILKYSQEYTTTVRSPKSGVLARSRESSISDGNNQTNLDSPLYRILIEDNCVSPLSAKSAPQCSPVLPRTATQIPATYERNPLKTTVARNLSAPEFILTNQKRKEPRTARLAKNRLRALINDNEMVEAWAWSCKCIQVSFDYNILAK